MFYFADHWCVLSRTNIIEIPIKCPVNVLLWHLPLPGARFDGISSSSRWTQWLLKDTTTLQPLPFREFHLPSGGFLVFCVEEDGRVYKVQLWGLLAGSIVRKTWGCDAFPLLKTGARGTSALVLNNGNPQLPQRLKDKEAPVFKKHR